jgi:6-pyruvoyltetrahydropterin/6-carboxytetrahydropterin synthase
MRVEKTFTFEASHRLVEADHKRCRGIHGHSYIVTVSVEGDVDPYNGMVLDFSILKKIAGSLVDQFDHALVLSENDDLTNMIPLSELNSRWIIMPCEPTAENMAAYLMNAVAKHPEMKYHVHEVRVNETATSCAVCSDSKDWVYGEIQVSDVC